MRYILILLSFTFIQFSFAMERVSFNHNGEERSYLVHIPNTKKESYDLIVGLHGYTGSASGFEKETTGGFNSYADEKGIIVIYPQGNYFYEKSYSQKGIYVSSWNHLESLFKINQNTKICNDNAQLSPIFPNCKNKNKDECFWTSCSNDLGFIKDIVIRVKKDFPINKTYVMGLSNGGMMAQSAGCEFPEIFDGVINIVGMQPYELSCIPDKPISLIIYGGILDKTTPPVSIQSSGGYLYEPLLKTASDWAKKFKCKESTSYNISKPFNTTETIFRNCEGGKTITAILNNNSGHSWPGISSNNGYCRAEIQSEIIFNECREINKIEGSRYLLNRIFSQ